MPRRALAIVFGYMLAASVALADAWETGPLDNDAALDFLSQAARSDSVAPLREIFMVVLADARTVPDDKTASRSVAAAELVAALIGVSSPDLPETAQVWAKRYAVSADAALVRLAISAVNRIAASSETRALWLANGDKDLDAWLAGLTELRERLAGAMPLR
jgi:hypothetical protein